MEVCYRVQKVPLRHMSSWDMHDIMFSLGETNGARTKCTYQMIAGRMCPEQGAKKCSNLRRETNTTSKLKQTAQNSLKGDHFTAAHLLKNHVLLHLAHKTSTGDWRLKKRCEGDSE